MADETREQAEAALKEVEAITAKLLPEPKGELVAADAADPAVRAEIEKRKAEIDISNTQSIIRFGSGGAGRAAGDQPGDARGGPQQGRRARPATSLREMVT